MTQLTDKERTSQMNDMRSFDEQVPCVGIFWYNPAAHNLVGVNKRELTPREVEKGVSYISFAEFKNDISQVPRERVAWTIDMFIVLVSRWAEPVKEELSTLIEDEFGLPCIEFVDDRHC